MDRVLANRWLTIGACAAIIVVSAGLAIGVVTLLGGDELSKAEGPLYRVPDPIGPPPEVPRSPAADVLETKVWDDMTADERELVEREAKRAFENVTFRTDNGFILGIDVYRREGKTLASRQYIAAQGVNGEDTGTATVFYCRDEADQVQGYRYLNSALGTDFFKGRDSDEFPPAWEPVMQNSLWDDVKDLGFRESDGGRRLHGFELGYRLIATNTDEPQRVQHWFEVETAQLAERGAIYPEQKDTDNNWYVLKYDELLPIVLPADLEKPDCVQEILAKIQ
jgi:hypothetical protein